MTFTPPSALRDGDPWKNSYWNDLISAIKVGFWEIGSTYLPKPLILTRSRQHLDGGGHCIYGFERWGDQFAGGANVAFVDVCGFDAKGDGVEDDTASIQAAIDSLPFGGGTIFFPPGVYKITSGLDLDGTGARQRVVLMGAGPSSVIAPTAAVTGDVIYALAGDGFSIQDLRVMKASSISGIHLKHVGYSSILRCWIEGDDGSGIQIDGNDAIVHVDGCRIDGGGTQYCGIFVNGTTTTPASVTINDCRVEGCQIGIYRAGACRRFSVNECQVDNCNFGLSSYSTVLIDQGIIVGCMVTDSGSEGIGITYNEVGNKGNVLSENVVCGSAALGINAYQGQGNIVSSNVVIDSATWGIHLISGAAQNSILGNAVHGCGVSGAERQGIYVYGGDRNSIFGNAVTDYDGSFQNYGIAIVDSTSENNAVVANAAFGQTGAIFDSGTDTDISHNAGDES